ncbi:hypothetical protein PGT21_009159 [Puccinia graminis f. sp. tritici]|uniref:Uncharacterized protein n=1 Tax=Puccinia graminis f. sp. tritici TaxID=56615 RepID=A0A5B0PTD2_PUCGR|nr:hypothetical protein PGT21_009159 [Puccinia graminis f. sp. tritici]
MPRVEDSSHYYVVCDDPRSLAMCDNTYRTKLVPGVSPHIGADKTSAQLMLGSEPSTRHVMFNFCAPPKGPKHVHEIPNLTKYLPPTAAYGFKSPPQPQRITVFGGDLK